MNQATAHLNYLRIAPRKVRLVADTVRGLSAQEAEAQLLVMRQRSAPALLKLLRSAIANAKNKNLKINTLVVKAMSVDQGPILKRIMPRAQGRATPIHKKTSHITIVLAESAKEFKPRFVIIPREKKILKSTKQSGRKALKSVQPKPELKAEGKKAEEPGIIRKIFKRKTI